MGRTASGLASFQLRPSRSQAASTTVDLPCISHLGVKSLRCCSQQACFCLPLRFAGFLELWAVWHSSRLSALLAPTRGSFASSANSEMNGVREPHF